MQAYRELTQIGGYTFLSKKMQIPQIDDFHVHLRQAELMNLVTPLLEKGGCRLAYVMPNLTPPITTTAQALSYKKSLESLSPSTTFLMTLYLTPSLTREEIKVAHQSGIMGVKSYPKGVTTNSESGIEDYGIYYPVFEEMEKLGMVLNLHGEIPSDPDSDVCVLNAEEMFLKHLVQIHTDFPNLKIVLEHVTSKVAVDTVKSLGDTVACTITVHHLELIVDDWAGCSHHFCKPVAKFPRDREALRQVVKEGHPRFFLGTDSAPHPRSAKETAKAAAGVFVTPFVGVYLAHILDSFGALDRLEGFACRFGRQFYGIPQPTTTHIDETNATNATNASGNEKHHLQKMLVLEKKEMKIPDEFEYVNEHGKVASVVPFLAGKTLTWSL